MQVHSAANQKAFPRLMKAIGCASLLVGMAASASAAPKEVELASPGQALAFCQSGSMKLNNIDYINSTNGAVQFGPAYNCVQMEAKKSNTKTVRDAMLVESKTGSIAECRVASVMSAEKLCNAGGL